MATKVPLWGLDLFVYQPEESIHLPSRSRARRRLRRSLSLPNDLPRNVEPGFFNLVLSQNKQFALFRSFRTLSHDCCKVSQVSPRTGLLFPSFEFFASPSFHLERGALIICSRFITFDEDNLISVSVRMRKQGREDGGTRGSEPPMIGANVDKTGGPVYSLLLEGGRPSFLTKSDSHRGVPTTVRRLCCSSGLWLQHFCSLPSRFSLPVSSGFFVLRDPNVL